MNNKLLALIGCVLLVFAGGLIVGVPARNILAFFFVVVGIFGIGYFGTAFIVEQSPKGEGE